MQTLKMVETAEEFIKRKEEEFRIDKEKNNSVVFKDIGRKGKHHWIRNKWICMKQHNYPEKVFVIERFIRGKREGDIIQNTGKEGDIEYRFGYYIVGKVGKAKGRWIWGQFCPIIPEEDFNKLIELAKKKGVIL